MAVAAQGSYWDDLKDAVSQDWTLSKYPVLRPLYLIFFLEILGFGMNIPVLVFFILEDLKLGVFEVGLTLGAFSCAQIFGAAVFGRGSDALGRRPVVVFCFLWCSAGFMATSLVRNFTELILARTLAGLSGGTWPIVQAFVLDVMEPRDRPKYLGLLGATFASGFAVGPGLAAGLLATGAVDRRMIFAIGGAFCLVGGLVGYFFLEESLAEEKRRPLCEDPDSKASLEDDDSNKVLSDWEAVNTGLSLTWFCRFFLSFGQFVVYSMYGPLVKGMFGFGDMELGITLMCIGILGVIVQLFVFSACVRFLGRIPTLQWGCIFVAIGLVLMPSNVSLPVHACFMLVFGLGSGLTEPSFPNVVAAFASYFHLGFANGWVTSFRGFAAVSSPLLAGYLFERFGGWAAFYVAGAAAGVAAIVVGLMRCFATEVKQPDFSAIKGAGKGAGKGSEKGAGKGAGKGEPDEKTRLLKDDGQP